MKMLLRRTLDDQRPLLEHQGQEEEGPPDRDVVDEQEGDEAEGDEREGAPAEGELGPVARRGEVDARFDEIVVDRAPRRPACANDMARIAGQNRHAAPAIIAAKPNSHQPS